MGRVSVERVGKRFGRRQVLDRVSLEVRPAEFLTILGPSGSGKTTLLRLIAGLEMPDEGRILLDGRVVCGDGWVPPQRRGAGMVFQNYALWPHMTAFENVAFPLAMSRLPRAEIARRTREAMALVELGALENKRPGEMSGGEQQRVALARALVGHPAILLMDESLSNLDARLREKMAGELRRVQVSTRVTTLYVTHDQHEAFALSDRVAVLQDGKIQQVGPPAELYDRPRNRLVALSMGNINLLTPEDALRLGFTLPELGPSGGGLVGVRPDRVRLARQPPGALQPAGLPGVAGRVAEMLPMGGDCDVWVQAGPCRLQARVRFDEAWGEATPVVGDAVSIAVAARDWIVLGGGRVGGCQGVPDMRKLILFNMATLDGSFAGPNGEIDWHNVDDEFNGFAIEQMASADALVFGRVTYEMMASYWPTPAARANNPQVARRMNDIGNILLCYEPDRQ